MLFTIVVLPLCCSFPLVVNFTMAYKIFSRKKMRNLFNTSLAFMFLLSSVLGPVAFFTFYKTYNKNLGNKTAEDLEDLQSSCQLFHNIHIISNTATIVVEANFYFRYFIIVHAEKGFVENGMIKTKMFKMIFIMYFFFGVMSRVSPILLEFSRSSTVSTAVVICLQNR